MNAPSGFTNRLIHEKSPYLLQHAHNPVDWYPWGEEAFAASRKENKPIFLSIGYATCHWCHVMEEEAFTDLEVAQALNNAFISIKVDREELPEIDSLYMEFAQTMIVGSAGWPLNLILTPDLKPFFAATYLPVHSARGIIGVIELTDKIQALWNGDERDRLVNQAEKIVDVLRSHVHTEGKELPSQEPIAETAEILFKIADPIYGGMQGSPKFPLGYQSNFLLRYFQKTQDARALFLVEKTLEMMYRGGIHDHLGGGFHRYAIDEHWHIPHFEKMLYDNAQLAYAYLEAWKVTHREIYKAQCEEICSYILRDMQHPDGGFYSAEDADSQGVEGLFYTWTKPEVVEVLGEDIGLLFCHYYGIFDHGMVEGRSVIRMGTSADEFAYSQSARPDEFEALMHDARAQLLKARNKRPRPLCDDKIITSWNGLMIFSLAEIGFSLQRKEYLFAATKAARFIKEKLYKEGALYRRYRDGEKKFKAGLDDHAFLIRALLSLFETGQGTEWLSWAIELTRTLEANFKAERGAFYQAAPDDGALLIRKCHFADGAEPSGNAVQAENLLRLYQITSNKHYLEQAEDIFRASSRFLDTYPLGYCYHLTALQRYFDTQAGTYVIALNEQGEWQSDIEELLSKRRAPHNVIIWKKPKDAALSLILGAASYEPLHGKTTLYFCHEGVCKAPLTDKDEIYKALT